MKMWSRTGGLKILICVHFVQADGSDGCQHLGAGFNLVVVRYEVQEEFHVVTQSGHRCGNTQWREHPPLTC